MKLEQAVDQFYQRTEAQNKLNSELLEKKKTLQFEISSSRCRIIELHELIHSTIKQYEQDSSNINCTIERMHGEIQEMLQPNNQYKRQEITAALIQSKQKWKSIYSTHFQHYEKRISFLNEEINHQRKIAENFVLSSSSDDISRQSVATNSEVTRETQNQANDSHPSPQHFQYGSIETVVENEAVNPYWRNSASNTSNIFGANQPWFRENRKRKLTHQRFDNQGAPMVAQFANGLDMFLQNQHQEGNS